MRSIELAQVVTALLGLIALTMLAGLALLGAVSLVMHVVGVW